MEAYKAGLLKELILHKDELYPLDIDITYVTNEILKKISQTTTPSKIMGLVEKKKEESIIGERVLILDNIQDPGNLGTIIRSAVAFNIDTIVSSDDTVDLYNPKVVRASQGMIFHINIVRRDIIDTIDKLHELDYEILGTSVDVGMYVDKVELTNKYALVMGNEGNGVHDEILDMCDHYIYIPMNNKVESLNVAVATSIILYEFNKRG
jgi:TrmH family RNA methyltransferase